MTENTEILKNTNDTKGHFTHKTLLTHDEPVEIVHICKTVRRL